jgi:hypothetical protein
MERVHTAVFVLVSILFSVASSVAATQIGKPLPGGPSLVRVVGCLEQRGQAWWLTKATEPEPNDGPNSNEAKVKESAAKPLGTLQFHLIGMGVFSPAAQKGHKVEAIGMLIKDAPENRVNLTSLVSVSSTACAQ